MVAWCRPEQQVERLMAKTGVSREEAERRIQAQMPVEEKRRRADYLIDCSGSMEETRRQAEAIYLNFRRIAKGGRDRVISRSTSAIDPISNGIRETPSAFNLLSSTTPYRARQADRASTGRFQVLCLLLLVGVSRHLDGRSDKDGGAA